METVRIDLGDGAYAVVAKEMRHGTAKLIRQYFRTCFKPKSTPLMLSAFQNLDQVIKLLDDREIDTDKLDVDAQTEIILLNQVIEWSFGPVGRDTLENIPTLKYERLAQEVDRLYSVPPLAPKP